MPEPTRIEITPEQAAAERLPYRAIIVGLNIREAEHEWRRLMQEEPEKYVGRRVMLLSPDSRHRLHGIDPNETEVIVDPRVGRHPRYPELREALRLLDARRVA